MMEPSRSEAAASSSILLQPLRLLLPRRSSASRIHPRRMSMERESSEREKNRRSSLSRRFFSLTDLSTTGAHHIRALPDARIAKRSETFLTTRRSPMLNVRSFLDSSRSGRKTIRGNDSCVSAGYRSPTRKDAFLRKRRGSRRPGSWRVALTNLSDAVITRPFERYPLRYARPPIPPSLSLSLALTCRFRYREAEAAAAAAAAPPPPAAAAAAAIQICESKYATNQRSRERSRFSSRFSQVASRSRVTSALHRRKVRVSRRGQLLRWPSPRLRELSRALNLERRSTIRSFRRGGKVARKFERCRKRHSRKMKRLALEPRALNRTLKDILWVRQWSPGIVRSRALSVRILLRRTDLVRDCSCA